MKNLSQLLLLLFAICLCACSSTKVLRQSDGTLIVRVSDVKFTHETEIKGAVEGAITPASALSVREIRGIKIRKGTKSCVGYVDWTKKGLVELRLVQLNSQNTSQFWFNGSHRVWKQQK